MVTTYKFKCLKFINYRLPMHYERSSSVRVGGQLFFTSGRDWAISKRLQTAGWRTLQERYSTSEFIKSYKLFAPVDCKL